MPLLPFVLAVVAIVCLAIEALRTKSLVAIGLTLFVTAWVLTAIIHSGHPITL